MVAGQKGIWQKRDCPVKMSVLPCGDGWTEVAFDIGGDHHGFTVSGVMGESVATLAECLYALYPNQAHCEREKGLLDTFLCTYDRSDGGEILNFKNCDDIKSRKGSFYELPYRASFYWDGEGSSVQWTITRPKTLDAMFMLALELAVQKGGESRAYQYDVAYSDLCYALGKALTEAVKRNGFGGFADSVWNCDVNVRHLCFLKACGMGHPEALLPKEIDCGNGSVSSFADELELLQFNM